jgi:hypothetical protein
LKILINFLAISGDSKHFPFFHRKKIKRDPPTPNLIFCCYLNPHPKFPNPTITPSGRKVMQGEERKRKTPLIVDT